MKSKTMYLEGVSQNSDTLFVDHGGVFMSPVIGTTVGQCLKNRRLDVWQNDKFIGAGRVRVGANGHPIGSTNSRRTNAPNSVALLVAL
jgi:hypothetical protein